MHYYLLLFIIYGFLGWIVEVCYVRFNSHHWYNRGFLHMPFLPIYAFGALLITKLLTPFNSNIILVFIFGLLLTSLLEYSTSVIMEEMFATRWWDYSNYRFNINGRICLKNSILFAVLCLFVINIINPTINTLVSSVNQTILSTITNIILFALTIDLAVTLRKLRNAQVRDIQIISGKIKAYKDGKLKSAEDLVSEIKAEITEFRQEHFDNRISKFTKHKSDKVHLGRFIKIYTLIIVLSILIGITHIAIIGATVILLIINAIKLRHN